MIRAKDIVAANAVHIYTRPTTGRIRSVALSIVGALVLAWLAAEGF